MPGLRDGGLAAAVGGVEGVEVGLGGVLGVGQRVEIDEDRADDLLPVLAGGDVIARRRRRSGRRSSSRAGCRSCGR